MSAAFSPHPHFTTVRRLVVSRVAAKASVNVTCAGKGCPFSSARTVSGRRCGRVPCKEKRSQSRRKRRIDVTPLFAQSHLAPGARLQVSVTKQDAFGRVWVFVIRAGQKPTKRVSCLKPGSKVPGKGCSV
jgi:hypothetical protein